MITDEDLDKALDRIARTADGELLYLWMQRQLMGVLDGPEISDGALRANHGRRSVLRELMARMYKGIETSGGRTDQPESGGKRPERPIVFATREPTGKSRESIRERIARTDPELSGSRNGS